MGEFLQAGKLNPVINSTQSNFLKIFAAWIVEDDLAFTTGETEGIKRLFAFMQSRYLLPSDTTVRNTLTKMYIDMYALVKSELAVVFFSLKLNLLNLTPFRTSNLKLRSKPIRGRLAP